MEAGVEADAVVVVFYFYQALRIGGHTRLPHARPFTTVIYLIHHMLSTTDVVSDGAWLEITRSLLVMPTRCLQHSAYSL